MGKVTDTEVEIVSDDADEAGDLRTPLRLDVVASEATHKKLMMVRLESRVEQGCHALHSYHTGM